ncbi:hypothetical protein ACFE04_002773 [Oxalis oulophora]
MASWYKTAKEHKLERIMASYEREASSKSARGATSIIAIKTKVIASKKDASSRSASARNAPRRRSRRPAMGELDMDAIPSLLVWDSSPEVPTTGVVTMPSPTESQLRCISASPAIELEIDLTPTQPGVVVVDVSFHLEVSMIPPSLVGEAQCATLSALIVTTAITVLEVMDIVDSIKVVVALVAGPLSQKGNEKNARVVLFDSSNEDDEDEEEKAP